MASLSLFSLLLLSLALSTAAAAPYVCNEKRYADLKLQMSHFSFCDKTLPYSTRAKNLVASMTLTEKTQQLGNNAQGVPRLGLPRYNWWSEALHGVSDVGGGSSFGGAVKAATSFPAPITTASAFNVDLWKKIGQTVSTEARAMHNLGVAGLTFWSPNINLVRDPRWGRTLETPGEDPIVAGLYAVNYVRGLQDVEGQENASDPNARPLKVSACCKHYAAYDLDYWRTTDGAHFNRMSYNANVTERDMVESYLKPFEMCVKEGDVSSVMCSYNNINGVPSCTNARLLKGTVRDEWDLHGYIVSDCDSVRVIHASQKFLSDREVDATAQSMRAGLDLDCGQYYPKFLEATVDDGQIKQSDIDNALYNNYLVLFRLGYFDGSDKYDFLDGTHICLQQHVDLAADAARQGIVLLKNDKSVLPLSKDRYKNIAVVGPHANATLAMIGNYHGVPCRYVSPIDGFGKYARVAYEQGCEDVRCHTETYIYPAARAAREADATIVLVGLDDGFEAEQLDREDLELPGYQNKLISQVQSASRGPVILVVLSAGGVNIAKYASSQSYNAILWAGYPGQEGGQAIADVVFGAYNPAGRLPITWYPPEYVWQLPMTSQQFRPNEQLGYPGRTYKFYNGKAIYTFGSGLSYTTFNYTLASTQKSISKTLRPGGNCHATHINGSCCAPSCHSVLVSDIDCGNDINITIQVSNVGKVDGDHVVMLYSRPPASIKDAPIKQLVAFQRVFARAGGSASATFELSSCKSLVFVTEMANEVLPMGEHTFIVGSDTDSVLTFPFTVALSG